MSYPEENERVRAWFDELSDLDELMKKANQFMNYESSTLSLRHYKFPRSHNKDVDASTQLDSMNYYADSSLQTIACQMDEETDYDFDEGKSVGTGEWKWNPIELKHLPEELEPSCGTQFTGYLPTEFVFDMPKQMVVPDVARLTRLDGVWALPHSLQATPVRAGGVWCKDGSHEVPKSIHEYDMFKDELKGIMSDAARGYFDEPESKYEHMLRNAKEYFEPWQYSGGKYFDKEKCFNLMRDWLALYEDSHVRAPDVAPYASLINRDDVDRLHEMLNWLTPGDEGSEREPWRVSPGDARCHPWVKQLRTVWLVEQWHCRGDDGHTQMEFNSWQLIASNKYPHDGTRYSDIIAEISQNTTGDNYEHRPR